MSKSTISTLELFATFPDKEAGRLYFEGRRWPTGPVCPKCSGSDRITPRPNGFYHHASEKHLGRYVDEFTFRLNEGNVKLHTMKRLASLSAAAIGKRLTYADLTA